MVVEGKNRWRRNVGMALTLHISLTKSPPVGAHAVVDMGTDPETTLIEVSFF